jgi:hypothetical protein
MPSFQCVAEKYVSPEERARCVEILRGEEAERRRAETDDSIQRALKEMMYGTLENTKKEPTPLENMVSVVLTIASVCTNVTGICSCWPQKIHRT